MLRILSILGARPNDTTLFGPGAGPIYGTDIGCTAEESRLVDCNSNSVVTSCSHSNDAGVTCNRDCTYACVMKCDTKLSMIVTDIVVRSASGKGHFNNALIFDLLVLCQNAAIRLVNGSVPHIGRIEICWNETWGTICSRLWSPFDANVACRQLGYAPMGIQHVYSCKVNVVTCTSCSFRHTS